MKTLMGRPSASLTACSLVFKPPLLRPISRPRSPFQPAGSMPYGVTSGSVASIMTVFGTASAAARPSIIRRKTPVRPNASTGCTASCADLTHAAHHTNAAVAIDEDDATQHTPVIDTRLAMALGKVRPQERHLLSR